MLRQHGRVSLLDEVVERAVLVENDGKSGARLERAVLRDGRKVVVKRMTPADDFTMSLVGDTEAREYRLWSAGVLDRLPDQVGHCVLDAFVADGETVIVMSDLGDAVLGWDDRLDRSQVSGCFGAVAAMHRAFLGAAPAEAPACTTRSARSPRLAWRRCATARTRSSPSSCADGSTSGRWCRGTSRTR